MPFTIEKYLPYLNRKNEATGRSFWYDEEVAKAEGVPDQVTLIGKMRSFCQTMYAKGVMDPVAIAKLWNEQASKPAQWPAAVPNPFSDRTPIGNTPSGEYWNKLRHEVKMLLDQQKL